MTYVLIFLAVSSNYFPPIALTLGGLNLRPSQLFLPLTFFLLLKGARNIRFGWAAGIALAGLVFWLTTIFWTLVNIGYYQNPLVPFGHAVLFGLNLLHAMAIFLLVARTKRWRETTMVFVYSVAILNIALLALTAANTLGIGGSFATSFLEAQDAPLLVEGEVVGGQIDRLVAGINVGVVSVGALLAMIGVLLQSKTRITPRLGLLTALLVVGIILGFSRQSLISAAAGLVVILFCLVRMQKLGKSFAFLTFVSGIVVVLYFLSGVPIIANYFEAFAGRAALLLDAQSYTTGTAVDRTNMWLSMLDDFERHPLYGMGQDAFMRYFPYEGGQGSHSFPVEVLHTTGLGGFAPYLYLHFAILIAAGRLLAKGLRYGDDVWLLAGLDAACVAIIVSSFTNLIFWNPTYWLLLGLLAVATRILKKSPRVSPS
jgi:O-antigen ligase